MVAYEALLQNDIIRAASIFGATVIATLLAHIIFTRYVHGLVKRPETDVPDAIYHGAQMPFTALIFAAGTYLATRTLPLSMQQLSWVTGATFVIVVFLVSMIVSKISHILINKWLRVQRSFEKTPQLLSKVVSAAIYILGILVILQYFNVAITPLIATLGVGGLAIGLALRDTLSNFFSGLHILSDKPINVGDFIQLDTGMQGWVEDIGWRSTRIRTPENNYVVVPNEVIAGSVLTNLNMPKPEMAVRVDGGVSYGDDLDKVEKVTLDVAKQVMDSSEGSVEDFEPRFEYQEFGDSNITFRVIMRAVGRSEMLQMRHDFIKALKKRYDEEGITIEWPVRKIYHGDE